MTYVIPDGYALAVTQITNAAFPAYSIRLGLRLTDVANWDQTVTNRVANLIRDNLKLCYDAAWNMGGTKFYVQDGASEEVWEDTTQEAGSAGAADYCPPNVSYIMKKSTGLAGPSKRGRFFMPGVPEAQVDENGRMAAGFKASIDAVFVAYLAALIADPAIDAPVLLHGPDVGGLPSTLVAITMQPVCSTQKKRLRR